MIVLRGVLSSCATEERKSDLIFSEVSSSSLSLVISLAITKIDDSPYVINYYLTKMYFSESALLKI